MMQCIYIYIGMEPGSNSNPFVRSELRQRIEKTTTILGVDFPVLDGKITTGIYMYICICLCVDVSVCIYMCLCVYVYMCMYIYVYICVYI
jgi:hypothetical protein